MVRRLERAGFKPIHFGTTVPSMGMLELSARDARAGTLFIDVLQSLDVVAPRRCATIRHAGELVERRGLVEEIHLDRLPLVPTFLGASSDDREQID